MNFKDDFNIAGLYDSPEKNILKIKYLFWFHSNKRKKIQLNHSQTTKIFKIKKLSVNHLNIPDV
jgi:hypothetical protein